MTTAWRRGLGPEEIDADATRRARRDDGDDDDGDARARWRATTEDTVQ